MNGKGARIERAEKALEGWQDQNDGRIRFARWWNSVPHGDPAMAVYAAHMRARVPDYWQAKPRPTDPAELAALAAEFQAYMDTMTDEEFAARQRLECERQLAAHERGECDHPGCPMRAENPNT